jgi:hypothetical protein
VQGTGDGELVTFMTSGALTVDDPPDGAVDVYGYDAVRDELVRLSAADGGVGGSYPCVSGSGSPMCHGDSGLTPTSSISFQSGAVNVPLGVATGADGVKSAFFESRSRLVAGDVDGSYDVYQWREGGLSLVTPGDSPTDGYVYLGNDESGQNVYFVTRDALTWQDFDKVADVYTARVDGGIVQPVEPAPCAVLVDACQGGGAQATVASQATSSVAGSDGDADVGERFSVTLAGLSAKARRRAARTGVLALRVRADRGGVVRLGARARLAGKSRRVGRTSKRVTAGVTRVGLRLNARARRALASGRRLRVSVTVAQAGARSRSAAVVLRRAGR